MKRIILLILSFLVPAPSFGSIVFSNVTTPGSDGGSGDAILGLSAIPGFPAQTDAQAFTPTATYALLDVALQVESSPSMLASFGDNGLIDVALYADQAGLPGTLIEQLGTGIASAAQSSTAPLIVVNSTLQPILNAGVQYWIVVSPFSATSSAFWDNLEGPGYVSVPYAFDDGVTGWSSGATDDAQFQVDGLAPVNSAPEPSAILLGGVGLAALVVVRGRRIRFGTSGRA